MKIIRNRFLPLKGYDAMTFLNLVFVRNKNVMSEQLLRHEQIHWEQEKETLILGFYLIYIMEYVVKLLYYFFRHRSYGSKLHIQVYLSVSFEREAYANDHNPHYLKQRKRYCWLKLLFSKSI